MPVIRMLFLDEGDPPAWDVPNPLPDSWVHMADPLIQIVGIEKGMQSGRPSVMIRLDLPDGRVVIAETSLDAFQTANAVLRGRFGDPGLGIEGRG